MLRAGRAPWAQRLYVVIFEADTPGGKAFDVALLVAIVVGMITVSLESVSAVRAEHGALLERTEWLLSALFSLEYLLRLACVRQPWRYALSFFGLVDLCSLLPTYLSLLLPGTSSLLVIRSLRLLRVFRVLKLARFVGEAEVLGAAIRASFSKITVFIGGVLALVAILGSLMYLVEGSVPGSGFTSIPQSTYWAVVTMTTVGYGDIAPVSPLGKLIAAVVMLAGYGIIAVPTGIVSVELSAAQDAASRHRECPGCGSHGHTARAAFCSDCGHRLGPAPPVAGPR